MITIPKAGQIDVPNPPIITPIEFVKQIAININAQIEYLDKELRDASLGDEGQVKELYDHLHEIKVRSELAISCISDIVVDPSKLESALARIEGPGVTFYRVNQLIESVKELEKELQEGEYDYYNVVADLLTDVQKQMKNFEQFIATPHIALIKEKIDAIETELRRQVQWSFREIGQLASSETYGQDPNNPDNESNVDLSSLSQVYCLVDALGIKFRKDLLERFSQLQLIPYEKMFKIGSKFSGLEYLDQRYAWFKYLLLVVKNKVSNIFPSSWKLSHSLFVEFTRRTQKHLSDILAKTEEENPEANAHVEYMLKSLKSILAFEAEIKASFGYIEQCEGEEQITTITESISDAFDPYLGPYVQLERQGLEKIMEQVLKEEDINLHLNNNNNGAASQSNHDNNPTTKIVYKPREPFESSRKMFEYIKGSLKRCTGFSTGITYLSLSKEFRICLQQYAETLKFRCPSPTGISKSGKQQPIYRITKTDETNMCRIITTGEYCIDTIPALESMMKQRIKPAYTNEVDFQTQIDAFMDTVAFTTGVLVSGEVQRMDPYFQSMREIKWGSLDQVGDVGNYIKDMIKLLSACIPRIRETMSGSLFQTVCNKFVGVFLDVFLDAIWALKRINKTGGFQLLVDLNGIKEFLLKMPNIKLNIDAEPVVMSNAYASFVDKRFKKVEIILKLVCTEDNMLEETFGLLWPTGVKSDLDAISALKGSKTMLPINSAALDSVVDATKAVTKKTSKIGKGAVEIGKGAVDDIASGLISVGDNFKNVMNFNLFESSADDHHNHNSKSSQHSNHGNNALSSGKKMFSNVLKHGSNLTSSATSSIGGALNSTAKLNQTSATKK